jgi:hypothetical protein
LNAYSQLGVHETPQAQGSALLAQSYNIQLASRANPTFFGVRFVKQSFGEEASKMDDVRISSETVNSELFGLARGGERR